MFRRFQLPGRCRFGLFMAVAVAAWSAVSGPSDLRGAVVSFEDETRVVRVNEAVEMAVLVSWDAGEPGNLFSFGVRVESTGPAASLLEAIDVPAELDFFGADGPPAFRDLDPGVMGVKGTVDALEPSTPAYDGSLLAVYRLRFAQVGTYELSLAPFNTLGPTEELFVAGDGTVLDGDLVFGTARIDVIPEPGTGVVILLAGLLIASRRRR